ncbi:MAG: hypothetical protein M3413_06735 [Bacteroidota bacterium]|nr:hypothetical protein [Bacteroidota bacterium]
MIKHFSYIILIAFLLSGLNSPAQDVKIHPSVDSLFIPMEGEQDSVKDKKQKFSLIQSHDKLPVNSRQINERDINKIKQDKAFWYTDYKPKRWAEEKHGKSFFSSFLSSQWLKIFLFIIFGIAIVWLIISGDFKLFRSQPKTIKQKSIDDADQNIFETDFESEISKAITSNDYPLAIRLHYLQVLKELFVKNIIHYSPDHTNQDFVYQLRNSRYYSDFFSLTRSFEYIWYGKFYVSEPAFEKIQNNFISFKKQLEG